MLLQVFYFILSIVGLYFGAEISLEASERVGKAWKMSPLLIGMFIVGFGTSLPEFFVSQLASYRGLYGMALGNIIGSNIANIFLILGICSLLYSLGLESIELRKQFVFHLILSVIIGIILYFQKINLITTGIMAIFFAIYFYMNLKADKIDYNNEEVNVSYIDYLKIIFGFILLYGAGELLVFSGANIGRSWGISEFAISAIFVAFGTSFPELVTALIASYRKKDADIIIGNVIGSNIFNGAFVLGSIGVYDFSLATNYNRELLALILVSIFMFILSKIKIRISKRFTFIFLAVYAYFVYVWLQ